MSKNRLRVRIFWLSLLALWGLLGWIAWPLPTGSWIAVMAIALTMTILCQWDRGEEL